MFGVMGTSAAFAQAGCAKKKTATEDGVTLIYSVADPILASVSCTGEIRVISVKNGEKVTETYSDLSGEQVSIQSDANTQILINGGVTSIQFAFAGSGTDKLLSVSANNIPSLITLDCKYMPFLQSVTIGANTGIISFECASCSALTMLDLSANTALTTLDCSECSALTMLDLSANTALTTLNCSKCSALTELNLSANTALTSLNIDNCHAIQTLNLSNNTALETLSCAVSNNTALSALYYPATNDTVTTILSGYLPNSSITDGILYTDSAGAYYSTIETAATTKGWTIEQIPA